MNKIIKILGPSGAGKTTVVRELMKASDSYTYYGPEKKPDGYELIFPDYDVYVIGSYESNCGGVDTIDSWTKVRDQVDMRYPGGHVIYEGLLQSTYYGAMGQWSKQYGDNFIYAWLNTPLDVCMERLHARRAASGTKRPLNEQQAIDKWATVQRAYVKAASEGHICRAIQWDQPTTPQLLELLK